MIRLLSEVLTLVNMTKRILHIGNIAGVPQTLAKYQRKLGYTSDTLSFYENKYNYDLDFYLPHKTFLPNTIEDIFKLLKFSPNYDIYHFHVCTAGLEGLDLAVWKMLGKTAVIHYHGSEIRGKRENFFYRNFADKIFVSTPDLLKYSPDAIWIPNPVDLEKLKDTDMGEISGRINIVHAPSNRVKKGTKYILKAVKKLEKDGYDVKLILVENMSYEKALECYKRADIAVDQLLIGWYGMFAIECMALGKPVCVYIEDSLKSYMPFMPVFNTSPKNIYENLKLLIEDEKLRKELSKRGKKYVKKMHDAYKISKKVLDI